ncbi:hypothetical protein GCM10022214_19360 [Actinomadura miaoliensis]|uniref:Uncharacterized protein n=1 Tax=Actinomadura miaoliensis TaxID=430685 RepID=A0ABP7VEP6_9ACTN
MGRRGGDSLRHRYRRWLKRVSAEADRELRERSEARKEEVRAQIDAARRPPDWNRYHSPD